MVRDVAGSSPVAHPIHSKRIYSHSVTITSWLKNERHKQLAERWWIAIVFTWGIIRSVAVDKTFAHYGVNPYVYLAIVLTISVPYAITTAKLLFSIVEKQWRKTALFGAIALVFHFAPDAYILSTAKSVPRSIFDGFILLITIFTLLGIREIVVKVREHKTAKETI